MGNNLQQTIQWYDSHATEYSDKIQSKPPLAELEKFISFLPSGSLVLDAGCAAGRDSNLLNRAGLKVVGVDLSAKLIELATKKYPKIEFIEANLLILPFNKEKFVGVWASASLVHLETRQQVVQALNELKRVMKKDGILYLTMQNRAGQQSGWVKDAHSEEGRFFQFMDLVEVKKTVTELGFKITECFYRESSRPEIEWSVFYLKK